MAEPTHKNPAIENFLEGLTGRTTAIKADVCVPPPIGCGGPATDFRDEVSRREYTISGLCQTCQDSVFGGGEDEVDWEPGDPIPEGYELHCYDGDAENGPCEPQLWIEPIQ